MQSGQTCSLYEVCPFLMLEQVCLEAKRERESSAGVSKGVQITTENLSSIVGPSILETTVHGKTSRPPS